MTEFVVIFIAKSPNFQNILVVLTVLTNLRHNKPRNLFLQKYLCELLKAKNDDGCNVIGYTFWSLMDSFEWIFGYT